MPSIAIGVHLSTGEGCYPPSLTNPSTLAKTAFFNGQPIQLKQCTHYVTHTCVVTPYPTHDESIRMIIGGGTFYMEGYPVALIGDTIESSDAVTFGSTTAFVTH